MSDPIEVERESVCFHKMNSIDWMQNESTQNLRDWIRGLIDSLITPMSRQISNLSEKLTNWCNLIDQERNELKILILQIKQSDLWKEQQITTLFSKLEQIKPDQEILDLEQ